MICGITLAMIYKYSHRGTSYSKSFTQSLVAFSIITTLVIMVIGNNLARAFGLVGSMSIVRFRMAIKDSRDIVFIFFSLAVGMAVGVGLNAVALVATVYIGLVAAVLSIMNFGSDYKQEFLLQFHYAFEHTEDTPYVRIMKQYARNYNLVNVRSVAEQQVMELSYYVTLKKVKQARQFIDELSRIDGLTDIDFFFGEE